MLCVDLETIFVIKTKKSPPTCKNESNEQLLKQGGKGVLVLPNTKDMTRSTK